MSVEESVGSRRRHRRPGGVFAGGTVVIAILGLAVAGIPFLTAAGVAIAVMVLIDGGRLGHPAARASSASPGTGSTASARGGAAGPPRAPRRAPRWTRWGQAVSTARMGLRSSASRILLLALAAPVLDLQLGFPDEGTLPETRTERRAYDLVADGFGPGSNGPLVIAVDTAEDPGVVDPLRRAIAADAGIAPVAAARDRRRGRRGDAPGLPDDRAAGRRRRATRSSGCATEVLPSVLAGSPGRGPTSAARPRPGSTSATGSTTGCRCSSPRSSCCRSCCSPLVFRSMLVPLKAAVMNLLSIGAAYGVMVMVFQWGWGAGPHRAGGDRADHPLHPDVHVRDPVRAVDGLRGLPAVPGARGVPADRRQRRVRDPAASPAPPGSSPRPP